MADILKASGEGAPIIPRVTIERWIAQLSPKKKRAPAPSRSQRSGSRSSA
jgi:hypothetical protein